jgi:ABC-type spermidine/putrescine transport system permease subunit II
MSTRSLADYALSGATLATYVFLYAPIAVVVILSFQSGGGGLGFTLEWYESLLHREDLYGSLFLSIRIAVLVMVITTLLGLIAAFGIVRFGWPRRKGGITAYVALPMMLPIIVYSIGLFIVLINLNVPRGVPAVVLGHVIYTLPFATFVVVSGMQDFDKSVEEAAMSLGADELQTVWEVTLPLLKPSLIAAALFSFTLSFDEFLIAFFVSGSDSTLPVRIWTMVRTDIAPEVYSISVIVLIISIGVASMATRLEA